MPELPNPLDIAKSAADSVAAMGELASDLIGGATRRVSTIIDRPDIKQVEAIPADIEGAVTKMTRRIKSRWSRALRI